MWSPVLLQEDALSLSCGEKTLSQLHISWSMFGCWVAKGKEKEEKGIMGKTKYGSGRRGMSIDGSTEGCHQMLEGISKANSVIIPEDH